MGHKYQFERLEVWQLSISFTKAIYQLTDRFPDSEMFGLVNQIRRAGVSVSSNIAEGSGCISPKNQARFYEIAYSSLMEVASQMFLALELGYITAEENNEIRTHIYPITTKLSALRNSCIKRANKP